MTIGKFLQDAKHLNVFCGDDIKGKISYMFFYVMQTFKNSKKDAMTCIVSDLQQKIGSSGRFDELNT